MSCSVQIFDNQILKVIIKNVIYLFEKKQQQFDSMKPFFRLSIINVSIGLKDPVSDGM